MGRVLCIDYGAKRHGIALSDGMRLSARGIETLERPRTRAEEFGRIADLCRRHEVDLVVMGLPFHMDGTPGTHHDEVISYAKALTEHLGLDIELVDERRTTMQAEHHLRRFGGGGREKRKARVDAVAAAIILQSWLDAPPEDRAGAAADSEE
jgi:putative Holliday junction resolvase